MKQKSIVIFILSVLLLTSCNGRQHETIPAYIKIDTCFLDISEPLVQGTASHNIKDVWVYIGNQLQGVYELPAQFPILASGPTEILLRAGILINGTSNLRIYYPFFDRIDPGETILTPGEITEITPHFHYTDDKFITYEWIENYENMMSRFQAGNLSDTIINILSGEEAFEGLFSGVAVLENERTYFELYTEPGFENLPTNGKAVYLEMDYNVDSTMLVGVKATLPGLQTIDYDIVYLRPTNNEWKKIYINLSTAISTIHDATDIKIYFKGGSPTYDNVLTTKYRWDNLKLIY